MQGDSVLVAGFKPGRDPVQQVQSNARWLAQLLSQRTGKDLPVRGAHSVSGLARGKDVAVWRASALPWVLSPRALRKFLQHEPHRISSEDLEVARDCLSHYVRAWEGREP